MNAEAPQYLPYIFRSFPGFKVKDIKEFIPRRHMQVWLESKTNRKRLCNQCGEVCARSLKQQKDGETREDLFLTVVIDNRTHKEIITKKKKLNL